MTHDTHMLISNAFSNQRELNNRLRPDWASQGWRYYRAVWTEMAEAIMHTNWAWWKNPVVDAEMTPGQLVDLHIELCDILHFGLSLDIVSSIERSQTTERRIAEYVDAFADADKFSMDLGECLEGVVVDAILIREFNVKKFAHACKAANLDIVSLMAFYFGKTVLNRFRWDNGYKDKTYKKMWKLPLRVNPVEDNVYLGEAITDMLAHSSKGDVLDSLMTDEFQTTLYRKLEIEYQKLQDN